MTNSLTTVSVSKSVPITVKKNRYKHFNLAFLGTILFSLLGVGLFNYIIDPYGVFKTFDLPKLNEEKVNKDNNDRLFQAIAITQIKPKTVVLGSSRTKRGFYAEHKLISNNYQKPIYNLSINGPNIYEIKRYLEHAIANQNNIDLVVIGIDSPMFYASKEPKPTFEENRIGKTNIILEDLLDILLSFNAIESSLTTIKNSQKQNTNKERILNKSLSSEIIKDTGQKKQIFKDTILTYLSIQSNFELSSQNLGYFQEIVNLCNKNNIELKLFISPSHATDIETIFVMGKWQNFENWKRELVKITPIWDFSGYNTITTETIADNMQYYQDSSHYTSPVGNLVIERMFGNNSSNIPSDFGILLTKDNIESQLAQTRLDREKWLNKKPEQSQFVRKIKQQNQQMLLEVKQENNNDFE